MQSKVSMVIPCYNKASAIKAMFDSVISQTWDNIELIIVNDGSTDKTREIIRKYELEFIKRGYGVVIIDQENQGVAAAIRNGLMRVTGEFVCMPDCDDILACNYVYVMAKALSEKNGINLVVVDEQRTDWDYSINKDEMQKYSEETVVDRIKRNLLGEYLLAVINPSVCVVMLRTQLVAKLQIIENFVTKGTNTQEPQIWIPILADKDVKILHIRQAVYKYINTANSITTSIETSEEAIAYAQKRDDLQKRMIELCVNSNQQQYYKTLSNIGTMALAYKRIKLLSINTLKDVYQITIRLTDIINQSMLFAHKIKYETAIKCGFTVTYRTFVEKACNMRHEPASETFDFIKNQKGRLIAYGAGIVAKTFLSDFVLNRVIPEVIWDINANRIVELNSIPVMLPSFGSLTENDVVIAFLNGNSEVMEQIYATPARVFKYPDVLSTLAQRCYNHLYNKENKNEA